MKIVYLKIEDPIAWKRSDAEFTDDDKDLFVLNVVRVAGIIVDETDKLLSIAEISIIEDNPAFKDFKDAFPKYRYVMTVSKKNILERQDFEVE